MADQSIGMTGAAKFVCGIVGVVLFMWTPQSGKGFLIYGVLIVLLVFLGVFVFSRPREDESKTNPRFP